MSGHVDFSRPLFLAVIVGWIISVILHEFAHGLVAWWGGDYTIKERGGLSLNPLQYIDPVFSLIIPAVIFALGGIPLPGGVTYIHRELLRNRAWDVAVSLAGPAMNMLLFIACAVPLHPAFGWVDPTAPVDSYSNAQLFLGAMAVLQLMAVLYNLVPVPPLDGFQAISPFLPFEWRMKLTTPPLSSFLFFAYFMVLWRAGVTPKVLDGLESLLSVTGFEPYSRVFFERAYYRCLVGQ
jgi:Zn-dependent protease